MINLLGVPCDVEELGKATDLLVFHIMKAALNNLVNEVHDGRQVLLSQVASLLV